MFKALFVFIALLFLTSEATAYTPPGSCLKLLPHDPDSLIFNPDSVRVDSCDYSPTFGQLYAKRTYAVQFNLDFYPLDIVLIPLDTTVTWEAIDDSYSSVKDGFEAIEDSFGTYVMKRAGPDSTFGYTPDSTHIRNPVFYLYFDNYACIDTLVYYLDNIDSVNVAEDINRARVLTSVNEKISTNKNSYQIYPNPAVDKLSIEFTEDIYQNNELFQIIDVNGRTILQINIRTRSFEVDLSKFPNGIYYTKFRNEIRKLIITK